MKVLLKAMYRGAKGSWDAGQTIDVPNEEGKQLCAGGYAEPVKTADAENASDEKREKAIKPVKPIKRKPTGVK